MNDLFSKDGHLTDEALHMLVGGNPLTELERLELSEHLAFCDVCVAKYADLLEDCLLLSPAEPVAPSVIKRIQARARRMFANKYATAIAAACFAIVFWNIGVFDFGITDNSKLLSRLSNEASSFSQKTEQISAHLSEALDQFMNRFTIERGINHNEKK
ncbi:hypothetical protein [Marasmitruncus massiliensis]|uniref:hypothetical protein n=1 Tax=Marasmitruncus massiliensis TaxID=1944642 RepID=UPI000C7E386C|nr:hypothetical protein [Marasmitruncus massiliensis]MBE6907100.1 hypothetical protein [Oscillospiraceae bacterium]